MVMEYTVVLAYIIRKPYRVYNSGSKFCRRSLRSQYKEVLLLPVSPRKIVWTLSDYYFFYNLSGRIV